MTPDHTALTIELADYLHDQGLIQDPRAEQKPGPVLGVTIGGFPAEDTVDRMVALIGPWQNNDDSTDSTVVRFLVATRSTPWAIAELAADVAQVHNALDRRDATFRLTATQEAVYCRRVLTDPPAQDANRRWIRVDTYEARLHPPHNL